MGKFIPQLPDAAPLTGGELVPCEQSTSTVKTTTQAIADLASSSPSITFSGARLTGAAGTIVAGGPSPITFSSVSYDTDSYDTGGGVVTAPADGFYSISAWIFFDASSAVLPMYAALHLEDGTILGAAQSNVKTPGPEDPSVTIYTELLMSGGQTIQINGYTDQAGDVAVLAGSLTIHRMASTPATSPPPGVLLYDTFTDADGTNLAAHTMNVGPGWTLAQGTWQIQSNSAVPVSNADNDLSISDAGATDYTLTCTLTPEYDGGTDQGFPGLAVRYQSTNTYYLLQLNAATGAAELYELNGGAVTPLGTGAAGAATGVPSDVTITLAGSSLTALCGSATITTGAATVGMGATLCGLRNGLGASPAANAVKFNSFRVVP